MFGRISDHFRRRGHTVVEEAENRDIPDLAEIHQDAFAVGWSDGELARMVSNENYQCLVTRPVGRNRGQVQAFVLYRIASDEAEIITIATRRSSRRSGAASQLLGAAIRQLQADRVQKLFLEVEEHNEPAIALYKQFGFSQVGERKGYYSTKEAGTTNNTGALVMKRDLG